MFLGFAIFTAAEANDSVYLESNEQAKQTHSDGFDKGIADARGSRSFNLTDKAGSASHLYFYIFLDRR